MAEAATLHHFAFDPASRAARLALGEVRLGFTEMAVKPWEPDSPIHALTPSGLPPVLELTYNGRPLILRGLAAILGFADDTAAGALLPGDAADRAEARRLVSWFERPFNDDVNAVLLHERMEKPLLRLGSPDARNLREGREALRRHLGLLEPLAGEREWLAGRRLSQADLVAAAHLSVLDYFGEAPWAAFPALKTWYTKIKCRPCFRPLLGDRFPGVPPSAVYADLDF